MAAAWIEEIQEAIDSVGLVELGGYFGIDFTNTPYECFLSGFTIDGEADDGAFTLRIPNAAQFESEEFIAGHFRNEGGYYLGEPLDVVNVESDNADLLITIVLTLEQAEAALASDNALLLACSDELEVSAFDVVSITPATMEISFDYPTPTLAPLPTPSFSNSRTMTAKYITLNWGPIANASGYRISAYKYQLISSIATLIASYDVGAVTTCNFPTELLLSTSFTSTQLRFRIMALGDGVAYTDSEYSSYLQVKWYKISTPPSFSGYWESDGLYLQISRSGTYATEIAYAEYMDGVSEEYTLVQVGTTELTLELDPTKEYLIKARAYNSTTTSNTTASYAGLSDWTATQHFLPQTTKLSTPTGLNADQITSDSARIGWNAVDNASGYKVEYRQSAGGGQTYPWIEAQD